MPIEPQPAPHARTRRRASFRARQWILALAGVTLGLVALVLALRQAAAWRARWTLPTGPAQWIWAERDRRNPYPLSFLAARDFTLAALPARALLLATADQEYVLYVNGIRVGAGRHRPGSPLDVYEVGPLLAPGANRLVAELRSAHGDGGFLASLQDPASGQRLLATDGSWRTFERYRLGLVRGWLPLDHDGAWPLCWGLPPIGRWGSPALGMRRALLRELAGAPERLARAPERRSGAPERLAEYARGSLPGAAADPPRGRTGTQPEPPRATRTLRPGFVELDWGRPVAGYVALELGYEPGLAAALARPPEDQQRVGLVAYGLEPPAAQLGRPGVDVLLMPGEREWLDVLPRRFRYVLVVGFERPLTARLYPLDPRAGGPLPEEPGQGGAGELERGVAGIAPPSLHSPAEDVVRRQLERLAAGANGKKP